MFIFLISSVQRGQIAEEANLCDTLNKTLVIYPLTLAGYLLETNSVCNITLLLRYVRG